MSEFFKGILDSTFIDCSGVPVTVDGFMQSAEKYGIGPVAAEALARSTFTEEAMNEWERTKSQKNEVGDA